MSVIVFLRLPTVENRRLQQCLGRCYCACGQREMLLSQSFFVFIVILYMKEYGNRQQLEALSFVHKQNLWLVIAVSLERNLIRERSKNGICEK